MSDKQTPAVQESSPKRVKLDPTAEAPDSVASHTTATSSAADQTPATTATKQAESEANKDVEPTNPDTETKSGNERRAERKEKYQKGRDNKNNRGGRGGRGGKSYSQYSMERHGSRNRETAAANDGERRDHRGDNQRKPKELAEGEVAEKRKPKRKIALLLSYCGTGYYGMQINAGVATIEEELRQAFLKAGVVSEENAVDLKKVGFNRTARTDKGVHAAGQLISFKAIIIDNMIEELNKHLPEQFRFWDYTRVTNGFNAKNACNGRQYDYLIPTYVLAPGKELGGHDYRIDSTVLERARSILKEYEGTKNFHNYTPRKHFSDSSAKRYIMSFGTSEPFMNEGIEVVRLTVKGQSFMLHQIRKMVGMMVLVCKGTGIDKSIISKSFESQRISVPTAPALGLLLEKCFFDHYNAKLGKSGGETKQILWEPTDEAREAFKMKYIYPKMVQEELQGQEFRKWYTKIGKEHMDRLEEYSQSPEAEWRPLSKPMEEDKDEFDEENDKAMPDTSDAPKIASDTPTESADVAQVTETANPANHTDTPMEAEAVVNSEKKSD